MNDNSVKKFKKLDPILEKELFDTFKGETTGWFTYGPKNYLFGHLFREKCSNYFDFKTRHEDVWITTFPRSGTTLTQELVWLMKNNLDYETAKKLNIWDRSPFFEFDSLMQPQMVKQFLENCGGNKDFEEAVNKLNSPAHLILNNRQSPRVIKTHLPFSMLPSDINITKAKIIYVVRNPKDVALSYYHLLRSWKTSDYVGTFEAYIDHFQRNLVVWAPYWEHIAEAWEKRHEENVLFLFYEDMVKDMRGAIKTLANFLSVDLTDKDMDMLVDHVDIKNFKRNEAVNFEGLRKIGILNKEEESFIRQGTERGGGNEYTDEILEKFQKWVDDNSKRINITFPSKD